MATISAQIWFWAQLWSGKSPQAAVFGAADAVLAAGPAALPQFEVGELAAFGAGGEAGDPVPVDVGERQLRARMRAFLPHDKPHPGRPARQVRQAGDLRDPRAVAGLPADVVNLGARLGRPSGSPGGCPSVMVMPTV